MLRSNFYFAQTKNPKNLKSDFSHLAEITTYIQLRSLLVTN